MIISKVYQLKELINGKWQCLSEASTDIESIFALRDFRYPDITDRYGKCKIVKIVITEEELC